MDACAQLSDPLFQDIQLVPTEPDGTITISAQFVHFDGSSSSHPSDSTPPVIRDSSSRPSVFEDGASRTASKINWEGVDCSSSIVSGFEVCLRIEGTSELAKLQLPTFGHHPVSQLLDSYDGNFIFELPPSTPDDLCKKGGALVGMDRGNDCWLWTKCITTSAQIGGRKSLYSINKIRCVGSLKCENDSCPYLLSEGVANMIDWPDKVHCEKPYDVGLIVPLKSHVCGHCNTPPRCVSSCPKCITFFRNRNWTSTRSSKCLVLRSTVDNIRTRTDGLLRAATLKL
ncbi:hypothetical protein R1sor_016477 [Riccia sorocarpa]|uniref:Uncharacterized protein n=1 Tax=Riccia sorocarpa TaxID=122646 RepID=A0ABD3HF27_9MARC